MTTLARRLFDRGSTRAVAFAAALVTSNTSCAAPSTRTHTSTSDAPTATASVAVAPDRALPIASTSSSARATSSGHEGPVTRPTRFVWGEITRDAKGVVWIEERIEILPAMLEAAAGPDWASKWLGVQADMELELGAAPCVEGAACPLGSCRMQVERVVSIHTFDGKPEWQRPSPKRPPNPSSLPGVVEPPDFAGAEARRCTRDCKPGEAACDDRWTSCVENCLFDMFPPSGTSTR